jgi:hypothetical protein
MQGQKIQDLRFLFRLQKITTLSHTTLQAAERQLLDLSPL